MSAKQTSPTIILKKTFSYKIEPILFLVIVTSDGGLGEKFVECYSFKFKIKLYLK